MVHHAQFSIPLLDGGKINIVDKTEHLERIAALHYLRRFLLDRASRSTFINRDGGVGAKNFCFQPQDIFEYDSFVETIRQMLNIALQLLGALYPPVILEDRYRVPHGGEYRSYASFLVGRVLCSLVALTRINSCVARLNEFVKVVRRTCMECTFNDNQLRTDTFIDDGVLLGIAADLNLIDAVLSDTMRSEELQHDLITSIHGLAQRLKARRTGLKRQQLVTRSATTKVRYDGSKMVEAKQPGNCSCVESRRSSA